MILNHIPFMHMAYRLSNYSYPRFLHGVCRICYCGGGGLNQNRFWPNNGVERTRHVGSSCPLKGPWCLWWGPGASPRRGSGKQIPQSSWVFRVFKTPKHLSSHNFLSFSKQVLLQNQLTMLIYDIVINLVPFCSDRPIAYRPTGRYIDVTLTLRNDLLVHRGVWGMCPLRSLEILYFWNWNNAIWWILLGANLQQGMRKISVSSVSCTCCCYMFIEHDAYS